MRDLERDDYYGIIDTWDEMLVDMPGAPCDNTELGRRMTEFATLVRQDTDEIYTRLDDERAHACTALLMEREARMSAGSDYRVAGSELQETDGDYRVAGSRPQETGTVH
ncbi:hypothetical protein Tco_1557620 [Tanacetum coccineum]